MVASALAVAQAPAPQAFEQQIPDTVIRINVDLGALRHRFPLRGPADRAPERSGPRRSPRGRIPAAGRGQASAIQRRELGWLSPAMGLSGLLVACRRRNMSYAEMN